MIDFTDHFFSGPFKDCLDVHPTVPRWHHESNFASPVENMEEKFIHPQSPRVSNLIPHLGLNIISLTHNICYTYNLISSLTFHVHYMKNVSTVISPLARIDMTTPVKRKRNLYKPKVKLFSPEYSLG